MQHQARVFRTVLSDATLAPLFLFFEEKRGRSLTGLIRSRGKDDGKGNLGDFFRSKPFVDLLCLENKKDILIDENAEL